MPRSSRLVIAAGAGATERRVLAELERALPAGRLTFPPVVVVVPSHSLREHLLGRLTELRSAWLGVEITTIQGLGAGILARTGGAPRSNEAIEFVLIRRLASRQPVLGRWLGGLVNGFDEIAGAVRDLIDAGFEEAHLEAVEERLEAEGRSVGVAPVERASAIARVASQLWRELAALGLVPVPASLAEAARRLAADPERALPASQVIVHGFTDATGLASDLLEALLRFRTSLAVLDSPPDLDGGEVAWRFGARLRERLSRVAEIEHAPPERATSHPEAWRSADPEREARAAVDWIASTPPAARPEFSALVARDLDSLAAWAREIDRQALAGSSLGSLPGAATRRAAGLVELLQRGDETPIGVALAVAREALEATSGASIADLRLGFAVLGARTLGAAVALTRPGPIPVLPAVEGISADDDGFGRVRQRELSREALASAVGCLARVRSDLGRLSRPGSARGQAQSLLGLLGSILPLDELAILGSPIEIWLSREAASFPIDAGELRRWAELAWSSATTRAVGSGGGVALLSVTEARARTFDRLALIGLTRDRFPRAVRPDPLFPDALRLRLRDLLPDLPVKAEGHDEERYLFAQLLSAADRAALFRPLTDGEGRALSPSPLLDELLRSLQVEERPASSAGELCALDEAIGKALEGDVAGLSDAMSQAIVEARERFGDSETRDAGRISAARLALLTEWSSDPALPASHHLGPLFGRVGPLAGPEPRQRTPSVTALERMAGCGWRLFLERILKLAPLPELVELLPSLPGRLVGSVVHRVLEQLLPGERATSLEFALARAPQKVAWPAGEELERRVRAAARRELAHEAIDPDLFEASLAREALARLEVARCIDWPDGERELLAVEAWGESYVEAAGAQRRIRFRVDRVEVLEGVATLTDYKTGRPVSRGVQEKTRRRHLARAMATAEALQLAVYLLGLGDRNGVARYLALDPDLDDRARVTALESSELSGVPISRVFDVLFRAWDSGAFAPRLLEADLRTVYPGCASCDVREACLQGDSGARQRLARWAAADPATDLPAERPVRDWWNLRSGAQPAEGDAS